MCDANLVGGITHFLATERIPVDVVVGGRVLAGCMCRRVGEEDSVSVVVPGRRTDRAPIQVRSEVVAASRVDGNDLITPSMRGTT